MRHLPRPGGAWSALVAAAAPLVVFLDALLGRRLLAPGDGYTYYLPMRVVTARLWGDAVVPAWDRWAFAGSPLLAVHQSAVFYPPNLAHLVLPLAVASNVAVVSSFVVAAVGAWLLARRLTDDVVGAAVAGVAFGLCGFLFGHIGHPTIIASIAWAPWVLWGFELLRERVSPLRLLAGAGPLGLSALAGHSQMFAFTVVVLGVYALAATVGDLRRTRGRPLVLAALVVLGGAALAALQLLPVLSVLDHTDRSALDFETARSFSFDRTHSVLLAFPYLFGNAAGAAGPFDTAYRGQWNPTELAGYPGAAALVLAAVGAWWHRRDARVLALVAVAVVSLVMAFGRDNALARVLHEIPVLGQFRSWGRYAVGLDLAVAVLAAFGVVALRAPTSGLAGKSTRAALRPIVPGVVAVVGLLAVAAATRLAGGIDELRVPGREGLLAIALPLLFAGVAVVVGAVVAGRVRAAAPALVAVVALDMVLAYGIHYEWRTVSPEVGEARALLSPEELPRWGPVTDADGGIDRFLYASPNPLPVLPDYPRVTEAKRLLSVNGFDPLAPDGFLDAVGEMDYRGAVQRPGELWAGRGNLLDLLRVSVVVVHPPDDPFADEAAAALGTGTPVPGTNMVRFDRRPALPEAFLVGAVEEVDDRDAAVDVVGGASFDPAATAVIDDGCDRCRGLVEAGAAGDAGAVTWGPSSARVDVRADRDALLVISQAWFPGWHATVDGERAPVVRVDGVVQGVPVPPGRHEVVLRYRAPGLTAGVAVSGATVLLLLAWVVLDRRWRSGDAPPHWRSRAHG